MASNSRNAAKDTKLAKPAKAVEPAKAAQRAKQAVFRPPERKASAAARARFVLNERGALAG